jgi:AraC family transcriptional regulator
VYPARLQLEGRSLGRTRYLAAEISPEFLAAVAGPSAERLEPSIGQPDPFSAHVLLALAEQARSGPAGESLGAEALGMAVVSHLLGRRSGARRAGGRALPPSRVRRVVDYVAEHLEAPLSLRDLAGVAGMEVFRFVRAFKEATGLPPHRYVLHARVDRSKELLADRSLSISEVAIRTGFATPSHFSTVFRRVASATPRDYRDGLR